ncbi:MAG: hypothetical protein ACHQE5_06750 [Actinomycetes bacterium]
MDEPVGAAKSSTATASPKAVPARPSRWGRWLTALVVVAVLAGSALYFMTHRVDPAAQDADFIRQVTAATGSAPKNPAALTAAARKQCDAGSASLKYLAGLIHDNKSSSSDVETLTRIGLSVYCPNLSAEFEKDLTG